MNPPTWMRQLVPPPVRNYFRPLFYRLQTKIEYSRDFYENEYHKGGKYRLHERTLADLMQEWEAMGWKDKLYRCLDTVSVPLSPKRWLEPACHHGKTAFWAAERYPDTCFYMFDFSTPAVEFCKKFNPIPDRSVIWQGDLTDIRHGGESFDGLFDMITLLDVTEHLPTDIYRKTVAELFRVCMPGGWLLLKQGHEILPEHINILSEEQLVSDFVSAGFRLVQRLPDRTYLLTK